MEILNKELLNKKQEQELINIWHEIMKEGIKDIENSIIEEIKGIRVVKEGILHKDISASVDNGYIILPINKIKNILEKRKKEDIEMLKSNIIHEIYHLKLDKLLPRIHEIHKNAYICENYIVAFTIVIYIEYLAHLYSTKYETVKGIDEYFKSINKYNWDFSKDESKILMVKNCGYIIARAKDERIKEKKYIQNLKSNNLREKIEEVEKLLKNTQINDDYSQLEELENFVSKYISNE